MFAGFELAGDVNLWMFDICKTSVDVMLRRASVTGSRPVRRDCKMNTTIRMRRVSVTAGAHGRFSLFFNRSQDRVDESTLPLYL